MRTLLSKAASVCKWFLYPLLIMQVVMLLLIVIIGDVDVVSIVAGVIELLLIAVICASSIYSWICDKVKTIGV